MDAIVLVGGSGTRLRPVVSDVPKPLAPIEGRPFLDILLAQLDRFETIRKVVLAVGYKAEKIIEHYRGCKIYRFGVAFSTEEYPLGTGGAIKKALSLTSSAQVLILNGDSYVEFDLTELNEAHLAHNAIATLTVAKVNNISRYGSVQFDMPTMRIVRFEEKGRTQGEGWINAGCYLADRRVFDAFEIGKPISLEQEILPSLVPEETIFAHMSTGMFIDIGTPESYEMAVKILAGLARNHKPISS